MISNLEAQYAENAESLWESNKKVKMLHLLLILAINCAVIFPSMSLELAGELEQ